MMSRRTAFPLALLVFALLAATSLSFAAPFVDTDVRARLRDVGEARVIITLRDPAPSAQTAARALRPEQVRQLTGRVLQAVPSLRVYRRFTQFPFLAATVDGDSVRKLSALSEVAGLFLDREMHATLNASGPLIGQPQAEAAGYTGQGIGVAVIDTGVDYTHPSFRPATAKFFTDVKPGYAAWPQIEAVAAQDIVNGYTDGTYRPGASVKRDQMAAFIARADAGGNANVPPGPATPDFSDVPTSQWAFDYVEYCYQHNIVTGYKDGTYQPARVVNRDQMAVFLARAHAGGDANVPTGPDTASFPDVPTTFWAFRYIEYCKLHGITTGFSDGSYHPTTPCTRGQMAVFVSRAFSVSWGGRVVGGLNLLLAPTDPGYLDPMDDFGHGTMTGGVVASMDATYRGIAPGANLVALKVLDNTGSGFSSTIIAALDWCVTNQAKYNLKVVNLSLGDGGLWSSHASADATPEGQAVQQAVDAGLFVAVAAGNESNTQGLSLPAAASAAVAVGATQDGDPNPTYPATPADAVSSYSDRGELLTLYAPGTWTTAPQLGGGFVTEEGTSFASPHVAGAAAVLASAGITDPAAIRARLTQTGKQIVDASTNVATPRVDLVTALTPPTTGPDLVVTAVGSPATSAFTGDTIGLNLTVRNQGNTTSGACQAIVVLSTNPNISPQDGLVATVSVPSLAAGASYSAPSLTGTVPAISGGLYYLGALVDSSYQVAETNEVNNTLDAAAQITVSVPSAAVVSMTAPTSMSAGASYPVTVVMRNDGTTSWTVGNYSLGAVSPEGTTRWTTTSVPLLSTVNPGGTYSFSFNVTAPAAGTYACHWRMKKDTSYFGEVAVGGTKQLVLDDATNGQDYPAASGNRVAFMDYLNGQVAGWYTRPAISVKDVSGGALTSLPMDIPGFINPSTQAPDPPYYYMDLSNHYFPSISGPWVAWIVDDVPSDDPPTDTSTWYFQVAAYNLNTPDVLPVRVTLDTKDAWYPCVGTGSSANYVVWEDYRHDADGLPSTVDILEDNSDIYLADLTLANPSTHLVTAFPICTAAGPQFSPRLAGHYVVWEDWRNGVGQIYAYDLSVDSDSDGIPNWKEASHPSPDPAEFQVTTNTGWMVGWPDVSENGTAVWLDYSAYTGPGGPVGIVSADLVTLAQTPVVAAPAAYRQQVRIDGTQVIWDDWRSGNSDLYWTDLALPDSTAILGASSVYDGAGDLAGNRLAYAKYRGPGTLNGEAVDVYNIWTSSLLPTVTVTP